MSWALAAILAAAITAPQDAPPTSPPAPQNPPAPEATTALEDVVVEQRRLESFVRDFVGEVGAPARNRGLARWQGGICVGVVNVRSAVAQPIADQISRVGMDLGLVPGDPGCTPNIAIVFTSDGAGLATALVGENRRAFRMGGALNRDAAALRDFQTSDRPVRWWHISVPVDSDTGQRAVRLPGDIDPSTGRPTAPNLSVFASRLNTQIRDDLNKVIVIVDIDQMGAANLAQLADYLALVSLAQIDPEADTASYDTVLNLFRAPEGVEGLTDWDMSYLSSLYRVQNTPVRRINPAAQASNVASDMLGARRAAEREQDEETPR